MYCRSVIGSRFDQLFISVIHLQAAAGSGGAALRSGGEGEGGAGAEERDQLGQTGSPAAPGAQRGNREREEPAEIRRGGAGAGDDVVKACGKTFT